MILPHDHRRGYVGYLPAWQTTKTPQSSRLPTPTRRDLVDFHGYTREHEKIIATTTALLAAKSAVNVLLYGNARTGKTQPSKRSQTNIETKDSDSSR